MKHNAFPFFILFSVFTMGILHVLPNMANSQSRVPSAKDLDETTMIYKDPGKSDRGLLRIGFEMKGVNTLDPHFATESRELAIAEMLFNRLIRHKPGSAAELEPDLAETIPKSKIVHGKQVWIFKLRKGVMFHPGPETAPYEMTADDVVYSLRKAANIDAKYAGDYSGITVEKVDDYSVRIISEKPMSFNLFAPRLATYAGGFIISKGARETMGNEDFKIHPVGTGPFMMAGFIPGNQIRLEANGQYFRRPPFLDGVEIHFVPDIMDREAALDTGDLDIIEGEIETTWVERMEHKPDVVADLQGIGEVAMLHFNTSMKPMNDIRIRKAIAYALDRDVFLKDFGTRVAQNIYSPVPAKFLTGGLEREKIEHFGLDYAANMETARELLKEAGYPPHRLFLDLVSSEKPVYRKYYESMKAQLAKIGIDCALKIVNHPVMHTRIRWDENPLIIYIAWRPDTDATLTRFFHSDSVVVEGARPDTNFSHYRKVDKLIEAARLETDAQEQAALWRYAQIKILDHIVAYPLHYISPVYARKTYVDYGHDLTPTALYPLVTEKTRKQPK